jgi:hypothetical protein
VFMYSGTSIRFAFTGTSVSIKMKDDSLRNWFLVRIDDSLFTIIANNPTNIYLLANNLPVKKHEIEIWRRTEYHGGNTTFSGIFLEPGSKLLPIKRRRRTIEFIGDSYTCGYGNEGKRKEEHFEYATENNYQTFGAIVSRAFNANYVAVCRSGIGMYQGYGGNKKFTQPLLYDEVVNGSNARWDYKRKQPDLVVITLGANDFSVKIDSIDFVNAYVLFVTKLKKQFPSAAIICSAGPSSPGENCDMLRKYVHAVVNYFAASDKHIYYFQYTPFVPDGSDWHPNIVQHQQMAKELIVAIKKLKQWL